MGLRINTPGTWLIAGIIYLSGMIFAGNHYQKESADYLNSLVVKRDSIKVQESQIEKTISNTKQKDQNDLLSLEKSLKAQIASFDSSIDAAKDEKNKVKIFAKSFMSWGYLAD